MARLHLFTIWLAFAVILLGAYTRLTDSGLGCPDWPGCYGQVIAPTQPDAIAKANAAYPDTPVEVFKAHTEMAHRYLASTLGACILLLTFGYFRKSHDKAIRIGGFILLGLVIWQGMFGMWTVTLKLYPTVVMGHLMFGFATMTLLWWLRMRLMHRSLSLGIHTPVSIRHHAHLALLMVTVQIMLGGWTSANYAALACPDFPLCQGALWPQFSWGAFDVLGAISAPDPITYLDFAARTTIHLFHRMGAIGVLVIVGSLLWRVWQALPQHRLLVQGILGILGVQITLGITNVVAHLPISVAVLHNGFGLLLLLSLVTLMRQLKLAQA